MKNDFSTYMFIISLILLSLVVLINSSNSHNLVKFEPVSNQEVPIINHLEEEQLPHIFGFDAHMSTPISIPSDINNNLLEYAGYLKYNTNVEENYSKFLSALENYLHTNVIVPNISNDFLKLGSLLSFTDRGISSLVFVNTKDPYESIILTSISNEDWKYNRVDLVCTLKNAQFSQGKFLSNGDFLGIFTTTLSDNKSISLIGIRDGLPQLLDTIMTDKFVSLYEDTEDTIFIENEQYTIHINNNTFILEGR